MTWRRWLITIVSFAASIGVSVWIIFRSWPVEERSVGLPLLAHALCAAAVAIDLALRAMKIRLSGASLGIPVSFGVAMRTGLAGDFAAAITPARTGAEPARYLVLAKARISPAATFLLLFAELFLEMLALVIVAMGIALFVTDEPDSSLAWIVGLVGGYAQFVIAAAPAVERDARARRAARLLHARPAGVGAARPGPAGGASDHRLLVRGRGAALEAGAVAAGAVLRLGGGARPRRWRHRGSRLQGDTRRCHSRCTLWSLARLVALLHVL